MDANTPGKIIAKQLRRWRNARGLSAQGVADRLAAIGSDLDRRALSKIENGTRGVSVDEWLQIAHALAVPPPLLFMDLRSGDPVAIAPQLTLDPWTIWHWVTAELASPVTRPADHAGVSWLKEYLDATAEIHLYAKESRRADATHWKLVDLRFAERSGDPDEIRAATRAYQEALRDLTETVDQMIEREMTPPARPAEWIKEIRAVGLSRYPDQLVVMESTEGAGQTARSAD